MILVCLLLMVGLIGLIIAKVFGGVGFVTFQVMIVGGIFLGLWIFVKIIDFMNWRIRRKEH